MLNMVVRIWYDPVNAQRKNEGESGRWTLNSCDEFAVLGQTG
jgi:hypothetical protein